MFLIESCYILRGLHSYAGDWVQDVIELFITKELCRVVAEIYIYIYVYIYMRERESERSGESDRGKSNESAYVDSEREGSTFTT